MTKEYDYPEGTKVHKCQHLEENIKVSSVSIFAGEKVRIELCRLCATMALGIITSSRIQEVAKEEIRKQQELPE